VNRTDALLKLAVMGVFEGCIPLSAYSYSDFYLPPDVGTVLLSLAPLISLFFRFFFSKIDSDLPPFVPTKKVVLGVIIGFIGAGIVVARPYISSAITGSTPTDLDISQPWVVGCFLVGVISISFATTYWSTYGVYLSPKKEKIGLFVAGTVRNFFAIWPMVILVLTLDYFIPYVGAPHWGYGVQFLYFRSWVTIMWMSIIPAYIMIMAYYFLVQKMGAEKCLTTNYLVPVLGNIIGLVYDQEWRKYAAYDYIFQFGGAIIVIID